MRSALHRAEEALCQRVVSRLESPVAGRVDALVALVDDESDDIATGDRLSVLALIKSEPGNVSLKTMLTEIDKLEAVRAIGLPLDLFDDVAPKAIAG